MRYITLGLFALIGLVLIIELSGSGKHPGKSPHLDTTQYRIHAPKLPAQITFAGEPVPLDDADVRERLDRELVVNTFWHSSTILHIKRANRWFPVIEPILKEEGVPDDFKYMAVAESALDVHAVSPVGAKGIWQFRKSAAREFGLEVNKQVDERLHIEKATRAACDYLKEARQRFGSWTLAAAAYNVGMQAISGVLEKQKAERYYDLYLNTETSRFIFRIVALKQVLGRPAAFGFQLEESQLYPTYDTRTTEVDTTILHLADFAQQHGISYKQLKILNPWLLKTDFVNDGGKVYDIKLPGK